MKKKKKPMGQCPFCKSFNIDYDNVFQDGDVYDYLCTCKDCKKRFREAYHLEYDGMYDIDGDKEL